MLGQLRPLFPQTESQIRTTVERWTADMEHDTLERLGEIRTPTLVIAGERDLVTPPWHGESVAGRIPGARYELLTGPGSSLVLMAERPAEFLSLVLGFLASHPLDLRPHARGHRGTGRRGRRRSGAAFAIVARRRACRAARGACRCRGDARRDANGGETSHRLRSRAGF
jgi:hypothetical protein